MDGGEGDVGGGWEIGDGVGWRRGGAGQWVAWMNRGERRCVAWIRP